VIIGLEKDGHKKRVCLLFDVFLGGIKMLY
jgi:hypothetical protein